VSNYYQPVPGEPTVSTRIIRLPAAGPAPANTLVYLECDWAGALISGAKPGKLHRVQTRFKTEFQIAGYDQSKHDWYLENTLVSATAMLTWVQADTDETFTFAIDRLDPVLGLDGFLSFVSESATQGASGSTSDGRCTAYVLCYEPRAERPPSGTQRGRWAHIIARPLRGRGGPLGREDLRPFLQPK
jgi:hypothetical protein